MRRAWRLCSEAAKAKDLLLGSRAQLIHHSTSQHPFSTLSNISALFFDKKRSGDSAAKGDQRNKVSALKDELLRCNGDLETIERVLEDKGLPLFRSYCDGSAVVELLKLLEPNLAFQVLCWRREQRDYGAPMTAEEYARGIAMAGRVENVLLAEELFAEAAKNSLKGTSVYNALMGAYMYNKMYTKCKSLFLNLKDEATCQPTIVSYNILISVFGRLVLTDHMEAALQEIEDENISPDVTTFNNLIAGYLTARMWNSMEKACVRMKAAGVVPDLTTHLLMLRGYAHSGRLEKMEEVYELVKDHVNSKETALIRAMICAYCKSTGPKRVGRIEELLVLLPENEYRPWLNVLLIRLYAKEDFLEDMENSINQAIKKNTSVKTASIMRCIASSYYRQNAVDKFAKFVNRAELAGWNICRSLYHCQMVMYAAQRRLSDMEKVIYEMDQVNLDISKKTCWILYKAYMQWGETRKVEQVRGIMCKHGYGIPISL